MHNYMVSSNYLYLIIIIICLHTFHHHQIALLAWLSLTLSLHLSLSSIAAVRFFRLYPESALSCRNFLLVGQHWHIHVKGSIGECHLWLYPCLSSNVPHVLFILLERFLRWEVSGGKAVILWHVTSRIYSI